MSATWPVSVIPVAAWYGRGQHLPLSVKEPELIHVPF
jgi:hypothetical protein